MHPPAPRLLCALFATAALLPAQQDRAEIDARIRRELAAKGQLTELEQAWKEGSKLQRHALLRAKGQLAAAARLLEPGAERLLLLEAAGDARAALEGWRRLNAGDLPAGIAGANQLLRQIELSLFLEPQTDVAALVKQAAERAGSVEFNQGLGILLHSYGETDLALRYHEAGELRGKRRLHVFLRRATWQQAAGRPAAAVTELWKAYTAAPLVRDRRFVLSRMTAVMRRAARLPELEKQFAARPEPDLHVLRARLAVQRELGMGEASLALMQAHPELVDRLGPEALSVAVECGARDQALRLGRELLARKPDEQSLRQALCLLLCDLQRSDEAETLLQAGIPQARTRRRLTGLARAALDLNLDGSFAAVLAALRQRPEAAARLQALMLEIHAARRKGDKQAAIALARKGLETFQAPTDQLELAETLESLGEAKAALELYQAIYAETGAEDLGLRVAWLLNETNQKPQQDRAYEIYRRIWLEAGSPARRVQAEERVLDTAARAGKLADLAIELEEALEKPEVQHRASLQAALVKIYTRARDSIGAAQILRAKAKEPGKRIEALNELARMYLEAEEFLNYERVLRDLLELDPTQALDYYQQLCMSALERGRPARAQQIIREMLADENLAGKGAAADVAFEFAAGVYTLAGEFEAAAKVYRRALNRNPERIETLLLLANVLRSADRRDEAIGMFCDVLLQDVKDDLLLVAVDGLLNMEAGPDELWFAVRTLRRRIANRPQKVYLYRGLQDLLETLRKPDLRQQAMLSMLLVAGEQRTPFLRELMDEAQAAKQTQAYLEFGYDLLAQAQEVPPAVFLELGEAMLERKQYRAAERAFSRARLATDFAAMERRIAEIYEQAGRLADAERVQRRVLRRDPEDVKARYRLARLVEQRGARADARGLYTQLTLQLSKGADPGALLARPPRRAGRRLPFSRNRNQDERVQAKDCLQGALRCSQTPADLQDLLRPLHKDLAESQQAPTVWRALQGLGRIYDWFGPGPHPRLDSGRKRLLQLADLDAKIRAEIAAAQLGRGDLNGAKHILAALPEDAEPALRCRIALLEGRPADALRYREALAPAEQQHLVQGLLLDGHRAQARAALDALLETKPRMTTTLRQLAGALEVEVDAGPGPAERLATALRASRSGARWSYNLVSALRNHTELDAETRRKHLIDMLPKLQGESNVEVLAQFLTYAKDHLPAERLRPMLEKILRGTKRYYRAASRVPLIASQPAAAQEQLVEIQLEAMADNDRNICIMQLLSGGQGQLAPEAQEHTASLLRVDRVDSRLESFFYRTSIAEDLDRRAAEALFQAMRSKAGDRLSIWPAGLRGAKDPLVYRRRLDQALEVMRSEKKPSHWTAEAQQWILTRLETEELRALLPTLTQKTHPVLLLKAATLGRLGDAEGRAATLAEAVALQPGDYGSVMALVNWYSDRDQHQAAAEVFRRYLDQQATIYPTHASTMSALLLRAGDPEAALVALNQAKDTTNYTLVPRLRVLCETPDAARRAQEIRALLQQQGSGNSRARMILNRINLPGVNSRARPAEALAPLPPPGTLPATPDEALQGPIGDLLSFFPEGADYARAQLRRPSAGAGFDELHFFRAVVAAADQQGQGVELLARTRARLEHWPLHAGSLCTLVAAAQRGLEVHDEELDRAQRAAMGSPDPSLAFLAELCILHHQRGKVAAARALLQVLLPNRTAARGVALRPLLGTLLRVQAAADPEGLKALMPGDEQPALYLDEHILMALWPVATPAEVLAGYAGMQDWLTTGIRNGYRRELISLPWCGWMLRAGELERAKACLASPSSSMRIYDMFAAHSLALAVPGLETWKQPGQAADFASFLLEQSAHQDQGLRVLCQRLAVILVHRHRLVGQTDRAAALRRQLLQRSGRSPQVASWLNELP